MTRPRARSTATPIYFNYEVYEKDRQRVIAIAVTIEPVDKQVADDKLNEITKSMSNRVRSKKGKLTLAETGTLDDDPNVLTLEYVSVPETTIPYSYGATPELLRQELYGIHLRIHYSPPCFFPLSQLPQDPNQYPTYLEVLWILI